MRLYDDFIGCQRESGKNSFEVRVTGCEIIPRSGGARTRNLNPVTLNSFFYGVRTLPKINL